MIEVVEEVSQGCTITLPRGNKQWRNHILAFVDDKRHYVIFLPEKTKKTYSRKLKYLLALGMIFYTS